MNHPKIKRPRTPTTPGPHRKRRRSPTPVSLAGPITRSKSPNQDRATPSVMNSVFGLPISAVRPHGPLFNDDDPCDACASRHSDCHTRAFLATEDEGIWRHPGCEECAELVTECPKAGKLYHEGLDADQATALKTILEGTDTVATTTTNNSGAVVGTTTSALSSGTQVEHLLGAPLGLKPHDVTSSGGTETVQVRSVVTTFAPSHDLVNPLADLPPLPPLPRFTTPPRHITSTALPLITPNATPVRTSSTETKIETRTIEVGPIDLAPVHPFLRSRELKAATAELHVIDKQLHSLHVQATALSARRTELVARAEELSAEANAMQAQIASETGSVLDEYRSASQTVLELVPQVTQYWVMHHRSSSSLAQSSSSDSVHHSTSPNASLQ